MLHKRTLLCLIIALSAIVLPLEAKDNPGAAIQKYEPPQINVQAAIARRNRTHRKGNVWLTITNWGFFGNEGDMFDPEYSGTLAPQCEFPGHSNIEYLFQGSVWIGALVQQGGFEFPRVSVGNEGWTGPANGNYELEPGAEGGLPKEDHDILERSTIPNSYNRLGDYVYSPDAISEQDFVSVYTDTLAQDLWTGRDMIDGPHFPLGIRIKQSSYSWSYNYAQDFILIDYEFENIATNFLKNLYVALYVDADVGARNEVDRHTDDICGFQQYYTFMRPQPNGPPVPDSMIINVAWIADNDGRPHLVNSGNDFTCPGVTGVRVVRAPNPRLRTCFNWWISNGNPDLDYGPAWQDDHSEGNWTATYGTPDGDARKYFVMSNGEFDFDQVYVADNLYIQNHPQWTFNANTGDSTIHQWRLESNLANAADISNGYDTRYLISWGPLGIFDHVGPDGKDVYRLNPGEKFHMTIGYVAAPNFHTKDRPQDDVSGPNLIDPSRFNFGPFQYNAAWAAKVYDNEMVDTNGDGWFGEDTGLDGLYAPAKDDSCIYFGVFQDIYPGPDADGTERNGKLDKDNFGHNEDLTWRPEFIYDPRYGDLNIGYTMGNGVLDPGDGIPDFKGPPPPPIPYMPAQLSPGPGYPGYEIGPDFVVLRWKNNAESPTYTDPFSGVQDFEGYRVYVSNSGLETEYELLAEYDKVDFAYYSDVDSMATYPTNLTNQPPDSTFTNGFTYYLKPVSTNTGLEAIRETDSTYCDTIHYAHPLFPRYYSVTAFDYGDPKSGTESLETARNAAMVHVAPSGDPANKVIVVPNPYRAYLDYTTTYVQTSPGTGLSWENQDDGTPQYYPQTDRRLEFMNLPAECLIRIYTIAGDLVQIIPHSNQTPFNSLGDPNLGAVSDFSEHWDLNSRNGQQVASGLYMFSVEDMTPANKGKISTGKFVIIR